MLDCPEICNADLNSDLMSSFQEVDETNVVDRTCNQALFLTDDAGLLDVEDATSGGYLTTDVRTRVIAGFGEIAARYAPGSETYQAAEQLFNNAGTRGVTTFFILGFWDKAGGESVATALDAINACQPCFTHMSLVHFDTTGAQLMDDPIADQFAEWANVNDKMSYQDSIDENTEDPSDASNLKARLNALGLQCQAVIYQKPRCRKAIDPLTGDQLYFADTIPVVDHLGDPVDDPANPGNQLISDGTVPMLEAWYPYESLMVNGYVAAVDLSQAGSGYSIAFKPQGGQGWEGIPVSGFNDTTVAAVTGQFPNGTINSNNNGHANVYAQTAGYRVMFNGMTVTGSYIDQCHLQKYLRRSMKDALATVFVNRRRIPYDDARGMTFLVSAISRVMAAAQANGHFTNDVQNWESGGVYLRKGIGWVIRADTFASQSASRKAQRLAPQIKVCYIPAGATHHVPVTLCTLAVPS